MRRDIRSLPGSPLLARQQGAVRGWILLAVVAAIAAWWIWIWESTPERRADVPAEPRPVVARGSLAEDEQNNIAVFKTVSPSVVHITTLALQRGFFPTDVFQVPQGTGSGFMWDASGHIVTNFHVIAGASGAPSSPTTIGVMRLASTMCNPVKIIGGSSADQTSGKVIRPPRNSRSAETIGPR